MKNLLKLTFCVMIFSGAIRVGFSRGDKIIPQVVAGPGWSTTFDFTNVSAAQPIDHMRLAFYDDHGLPWQLQTNRGTASSFTLNLDARQTLRVNTIGGSELKSGYAVLYDEEPGNSEYSEDYVLGISVFYQVLTASGVTETVSIPQREPTAVATVPLEIAAPNIYSAFAIVNAAGVSNRIQVDLYSENGNLYGSTVINLSAGEQLTQFLDQSNYFPGLQTFKGMAELTATGPFVLLSLLQTRAADGNPQYTLLVPTDKESLRRNSYMVLLQPGTDALPLMPIDLDGFTSDFYRAKDGTEAYSWDLEYHYAEPDTTDRFLRPVNYAEIATLGQMTDGQFDAVSLLNLKGLSTYTTNDVDVSDPLLNYTYAVRTDLGNYAKMRITRIIDTTGTDLRRYKDLVLEVVIYR